MKVIMVSLIVSLIVAVKVIVVVSLIVTVVARSVVVAMPEQHHKLISATIIRLMANYEKLILKNMILNMTVKLMELQYLDLDTASAMKRRKKGVVMKS